MISKLSNKISANFSAIKVTSADLRIKLSLKKSQFLTDRQTLTNSELSFEYHASNIARFPVGSLKKNILRQKVENLF